MRLSWLRIGAPVAAALLLTVWIGAGLVSAQSAPVRINGAIDKLSRGKSLAGAIMYDFSLYAAAQFASSDLDFIIIDMEHRGLDFERLETFLLGTTNKAEIAKQGNLQVRVPPIVRIPTYGRSPNEAIVKQVLDMGAFGIMFPAIENKAQALEAVSAARYPQLRGSKYPNPVGRRGNGNMPAAWFWGLSRPEYSVRADIWPANPNGELLLFLQIETVEGVKNVEEILSVPGIGVVFVGPNDLSWSLGLPQGSPEHDEAVQTVLSAAMRRNIPAAITVTEADVVSRLKQGFRIASLPSGGLEAPMDATLKLARTVIQR
ncbi:MAG TPA: aldolase/citrate lyase family protein [Vicinamibacterales bacterium]|nr:aldolase/citrate lyase family protein [Vicinamibacterales bacterium]